MAAKENSLFWFPVSSILIFNWIDYKQSNFEMRLMGIRFLHHRSHVGVVTHHSIQLIISSRG